ncbi:MAG: ATPase domain-containing protein [Halobacteriota archaeon]|nr:ATPase domain-containing protein [Halobacteriota archaeon]
MEDSLEKILRRGHSPNHNSKGWVQPPSVTEGPATSPIKSTGINFLDSELSGGLPAGTVVYFYADADETTSEVFLHHFSSVRKTYYFTTVRRPKYISQNITDLGLDTKNINFVDVYSQYYLNKFGEMINNVGNEFVDKEIVDFVEYQLKNIQIQEEGDFNIIIDTFSFFLELNVNLGKIIRLVNLIYELTKETGAISYLYVLNDYNKPENKVMNLCDAVFDVKSDRLGDNVYNKLSIPKMRGKTEVNDLIKFKVASGIQIDTTRDIA